MRKGGAKRLQDEGLRGRGEHALGHHDGHHFVADLLESLVCARDGSGARAEIEGVAAGA